MHIEGAESALHGLSSSTGEGSWDESLWPALEEVLRSTCTQANAEEEAYCMYGDVATVCSPFRGSGLRGSDPIGSGGVSRPEAPTDEAAEHRLGSIKLDTCNDACLRDMVVPNRRLAESPEGGQDATNFVPHPNSVVSCQEVCLAQDSTVQDSDRPQHPQSVPCLFHHDPVRQFSVNADACEPARDPTLGKESLLADGASTDRATANKDICSDPPEVVFTICLDRTGGAALGLSVGPTGRFSTSLTIVKVKDGLAKAHGEIYPYCAVQPGDRIVAINGKVLPHAELIEMIKQPQILELSILRQGGVRPPSSTIRGISAASSWASSTSSKSSCHPIASATFLSDRVPPQIQMTSSRLHAEARLGPIHEAQTAPLAPPESVPAPMSAQPPTRPPARPSARPRPWPRQGLPHPVSGKILLGDMAMPFPTRPALDRATPHLPVRGCRKGVVFARHGRVFSKQLAKHKAGWVTPCVRRFCGAGRRHEGFRGSYVQRGSAVMPGVRPKPTRDDELAFTSTIWRSVASGWRCAICLEAANANGHGMLSLRRCGHRVHALCLARARHGPDGRPSCAACAFELQTFMPRFRDVASSRRRRTPSCRRPRGRRRCRSPRSRSRSRKRPRQHSPRSRSRSAFSRTHHASHRNLRSAKAASPCSASSVSGGRGYGSSSRSSSASSITSSRSRSCLRLRRASQWCEICKRHLGWVELARSKDGLLPSSRCFSCERRIGTTSVHPAQRTLAVMASISQTAEATANHGSADPEEAEFEVDEFGFQLALEQIKAAVCPEDGVAVLEVLLRSRPTNELLEADSWATALEVHVSGLASHLGALLHKVSDKWCRLREQGSGQSPFTSASIVKATCTSHPVAWKAPTAVLATEVGKHLNGSTCMGGEDLGPSSATSKGFLGLLLERARRRAKRHASRQNGRSQSAAGETQRGALGDMTEAALGTEDDQSSSVQVLGDLAEYKGGQNAADEHASGHPTAFTH